MQTIQHTLIELPPVRSQYVVEVVRLGKNDCSDLHEIGFVVALMLPGVISVAASREPSIRQTLCHTYAVLVPCHSTPGRCRSS